MSRFFKVWLSPIMLTLSMTVLATACGLQDPEYTQGRGGIEQVPKFNDAQSRSDNSVATPKPDPVPIPTYVATLVLPARLGIIKPWGDEMGRLCNESASTINHLSEGCLRMLSSNGIASR